MAKLLNTAWDTYAKCVIPSDASEIQHIECKRTFMAGAYAFITELKKSTPGICGTNTEDVVWNGMDREIKEFLNDVKNGKS
jgi:hypothetical protein